MLVFSLVLLVSWFDYVNAGWTSQMRVTWEVCSTLSLMLYRYCQIGVLYFYRSYEPCMIDALTTLCVQDGDKLPQSYSNRGSDIISDMFRYTCAVYPFPSVFGNSIFPPNHSSIVYDFIRN